MGVCAGKPGLGDSGIVEDSSPNPRIPAPTCRGDTATCAMMSNRKDAEGDRRLLAGVVDAGTRVKCVPTKPVGRTAGFGGNGGEGG